MGLCDDTAPSDSIGIERVQQLSVAVVLAVAGCKFSRICTARSNLITMSLHDMFLWCVSPRESNTELLAREGLTPRPNLAKARTAQSHLLSLISPNDPDLLPSRPRRAEVLACGIPCSRPRS